MTDPTVEEPAQPTGPSRWRKRVVVAAVALVVLGGGAAGLVVLTRKTDTSVTVTGQDGKAVAGVKIRVLNDVTTPAGLLADGGRAVSPVFDVTGEIPDGESITFTFQVPRDLNDDQRQRLVVADQRRDGGGWVLIPAKLTGDSVSYQADHFSIKQVIAQGADAFRDGATGAYDWVTKRTGARADGTCPTEASSPYKTDVSTAVGGDVPPVLACPGDANKDGRPRMTLANQRGIAMDLVLPAGARVESMTSPDLSEAAWTALYGALGTDVTWLPAGGKAVISFGEIPAEVTVTPTNSAFALDVIIAAAAKGRLGDGGAESTASLAQVAQCIHESAAANTNGAVGDGTWDVTRDVWEACGGPISNTTSPGGLLGPLAQLPEVLFGIPNAAVGLFDSIRAVRDIRETIALTSRDGAATVHAPSPGYVARFDIQWRNPGGDAADAVVEIAQLERLTDAVAAGYDPQCFSGDEARAAVISGYLEFKGRTPGGFSTSWGPELQPWWFGADDLGGFSRDGLFLRKDDNVRIETPKGCDGSGFGSSQFGRYKLTDGQTTGQLPFHLIYPDIYGPTAPNGNQLRLKNIGLEITSGGVRPGVGILVGGPSCVSGPGAGLATFMPLTGQDGIALAKEYAIVDIAARRLPGCK